MSFDPLSLTFVVRNTTISFPDMPNFTLAARPLKTVNVMRLPLLSEYVHKAVAQVLSSFIAPNAFTIDAARLMMVGHFRGRTSYIELTGRVGTRCGPQY